MGMKKVYNCDICRDQKKPEELAGCNFKGMHDFVLDYARTTDGVHICERCLKILATEAPSFLDLDIFKSGKPV